MRSGSDDAEVVARLAQKHGVSHGGVSAVLEALRRGGGSMAQFSHADFGGMSQWSPGMTMVGDMFNTSMKAKLDAIASELAVYVRDNPAGQRGVEMPVTYRSAGRQQTRSWWPAGFENPSSVGSQNDMRYAVFPDRRRLVIDDHGETKIFDTADHRITGVSQAQSTDSTLTFVSQHGVVSVSDLERVDT